MDSQHHQARREFEIFSKDAAATQARHTQEVDRLEKLNAAKAEQLRTAETRLAELTAASQELEKLTRNLEEVRTQVNQTTARSDKTQAALSTSGRQAQIRPEK